MAKFLKLSIILLLGNINLVGQISIIPHPNVIEIGEDTCKITNVKLYFDPGLNNESGVLQYYFENNNVSVSKEKRDAANVHLLIKGDLMATLGSEGYQLNVYDKRVYITAAKPAGIYYGIQTLQQICNSSGTEGDKEDLIIPCISIEDRPAFKWRAFMLDEARHFKGKDVVFDLLDQMALLKMNVFHWHLTDDQGWRIEIKKYPDLTTVGGKRRDTQINGWDSPDRKGESHQGFYTQETIKEVIEYAAKKHITIIPEIEMPGHASAAIAAYPWLGALNDTIQVPVTFGKLPHVFNVADPKVYSFIEDVLKEVIDLFPGQVVHIGGDEVLFDQWKKSKQVEKFMKKNQLESYADVQIFFTNRVSNSIKEKERRMMGWNDILGGNVHEWKKEADVINQELAKNTIIHFWKGSFELMNNALIKGYDIVNSQHEYTYLDYDYNTIPLKKAYEFSPIPKGVDENLHAQILGLGCQMWSEWIPEVENLYRQVFPRLAAYAEVGWTQKEKKDFKKFQHKLQIVREGWQK